MATISSHTLNGTDGSHAGGVAALLYRINKDGTRTAFFETATDEGGRLTESFDLSPADSTLQFELVFQSGAFFTAAGLTQAATQRVDEIVLRFRMPDPSGKYHMPVILNPNSYSTWWSA
jgi:5-hydroxyisourate hydrolase